MPTITYSRTRESDAEMEALLLDAMKRQKAKWDVKIQEAQTIPIDRYVNPEPPVDFEQRLAYDLLIANGPMPAGLAKAEAFEALVTANKATKGARDGQWIYALVQKVEKVPSPYKGKSLKWRPQHKITKTIRNDGKDEWTIVLEGDLM